jgi:hypothetical protein
MNRKNKSIMAACNSGKEESLIILLIIKYIKALVIVG